MAMTSCSIPVNLVLKPVPNLSLCIFCFRLENKKTHLRSHLWEQQRLGVTGCGKGLVVGGNLWQGHPGHGASELGPLALVGQAPKPRGLCPLKEVHRLGAFHCSPQGGGNTCYPASPRGDPCVKPEVKTEQRGQAGWRMEVSEAHLLSLRRWGKAGASGQITARIV